MKIELNKDAKYILVIIGMCALGYFFLYKYNPKYDKYDIEISKQEEKIKLLEKQINEKDSIYNILEKQRDSSLFNIETRKENIKIIYKNYDKKISDINNLSTDSTIKYFSTWINQ